MRAAALCCYRQCNQNRLFKGNVTKALNGHNGETIIRAEHPCNDEERTSIANLTRYAHQEILTEVVGSRLLPGALFSVLPDCGGT